MVTSRPLLCIGMLALGIYAGSMFMPGQVVEKAVASPPIVYGAIPTPAMNLNVDLATQQVTLNGPGNAYVTITNPKKDKQAERPVEYVIKEVKVPVKVPVIIEDLSRADKLLSRFAPLKIQPLQVESVQIPEKINLAR